MKNLKNTIILPAVLIVCFISGCGADKEAQTSTLTLRKDGSISHTIVEGFEQNYYDADELSAMAGQKIEDYAGNVVCESVETKEDKVIVKMTYGTGEDYTGFNNRELSYGTVEDADKKGYHFENMVDRNGASLSGDIQDIYSQNHVLVVQTGVGEELAVNVYDNILCVSSNVSISGKKGAYIGADEESTVSYIIFR